MPKKFLEVAVLIGVVLYLVATYFVVVLLTSFVLGAALVVLAVFNAATDGRLFSRESEAGRRRDSRVAAVGTGCLAFGVVLLRTGEKQTASIGVALIVLVVIISIFATVLQPPKKSSK